MTKLTSGTGSKAALLVRRDELTFGGREVHPAEGNEIRSPQFGIARSSRRRASRSSIEVWPSPRLTKTFTAFGITASIESAVGVLGASAIASSAGVTSLTFGNVDVPVYECAMRLFAGDASMDRLPAAGHLPWTPESANGRAATSHLQREGWCIRAPALSFRARRQLAAFRAASNGIRSKTIRLREIFPSFVVNHSAVSALATSVV